MSPENRAAGDRVSVPAGPRAPRAVDRSLAGRWQRACEPVWRSLFAVLCVIAVGHAGGAAAAAEPIVFTIRLDDEEITPGSARFIERAIREAEDKDVECLVLVLDTPGGLLAATETIVKAILASRVCIVVYVSPSGGRAASAGVFITMAAHIAAMAPGTTIGAAHPVQVGGLPFTPPDTPGLEDGEDETRDDSGQQKSQKPKHRQPGSAMEEKIVNHTVAWAEALAEHRGRNAEWAAKAVRESLTVTADKALEEKVIDLVAADMEELLKKLDGREVTVGHGKGTARRTLRTGDAAVEELSMWWGERVLAILSRPNVAFLLMIFGFYGIFFELYSPGWGVSGTLGIICLLLAFFGLAVLPVNYLGLALVIVGLALFVAEAFVTSFGALTAAGVVCLVLGGVMLVDSPEGFSRVSLAMVLPIAAATGVIVVFLMGGVIRAHLRRPVMGDDGLIGVTVPVQEDFHAEGDRHMGSVFLHGEWWKAFCDGPLTAGQSCTIRSRDGLLLNVEAGADLSKKEPSDASENDHAIRH